MGAWGQGPFENDRACDWSYGLERVADLSLIQHAIAAVFTDGDIDPDTGCVALAACETLARLNGQPGASTSYTEAVDAWVSAHEPPVPNALLEQAQAAIDLVLDPKRSELAELWAETDDFQLWRNDTTALRARLS